MFKKLRTYQTLDELPIWNWNMVDKKNDMRYLYILNNYSDLPKLTSIRRLVLLHSYRELILQFDNIKNPLLLAKKKVIGKILDVVRSIAAESRDIEKIEKAKIFLKALIITPDPDVSWLEKEKFTETARQKQLVSLLIVEVKKYISLKTNVGSKKKQTLQEQVAKIETILGVNIDVRRCSVSQFTAYQNETTEKVKALTNG